MVNIYDTANQLEQEIRQLPQFEELKAAYDAVQNNEDSKAIYNEFQQMQQKLQLKQMQGESLSEDDTKEIQALSDKIKADEFIGQLMEKEQAFSAMLNELNDIIMKPLQDLYR